MGQIQVKSVLFAIPSQEGRVFRVHGDKKNLWQIIPLAVGA
jgi:hypothetical protein